MQTLTKIPRKLWIFWYQGIDSAPFIVKKCINSWQVKNPGWEINLLDKDNLSNYITLDIPDSKLKELSLNKQANLIRLQLLSKYGGVWVDATTLCICPLDDWVDSCCQSGFFAFSNAGKDREMSNWFLASEKNCPLVQKLLEHNTLFFTNNTFRINGWFKQKLIKKLCKVFNNNKKTTAYWLSPFVTKCLKVYPYFIFHYIFYQLISTDPECKKIWHETTKISPYNSRKIQTIGFFSELTSEIIHEINNDIPYLYKLTWKYDHSLYKPTSLLYYVLEEGGFEQTD